jgi:hypothetical protein
MDDRFDLVLGDQPADQRLIAAVALDECRLGRDRPGKAGREVVEDDDGLARVDQLPDHMAADVAGAAGDKYAHGTRAILEA